MLKLITTFIIIALLISCSSENNKQIEANLLISPSYEFTSELYDCKLNDGYTLLNLESFFSTFIKSEINKTDLTFNLNILFPKSIYVNEFVINIVNYAEKDIYDFFLEKISTRGFDEIASCNFDNNTLSGISLFSSEEQKEKTKYVSELLRCEYNEGYNYGTFRVAIERFSLEMKSLNIPYEALYLQSSDYSRSFVWVNNIFTENFSEAINNNWITNKLAENIKEEFIQNAKCIDSKKYDAYSIT